MNEQTDTPGVVAPLTVGTPASGSDAATVARPTRTYTGAALERRKAWGREWGAVAKEISVRLHANGA